MLAFGQKSKQSYEKMKKFVSGIWACETVEFCEMTLDGSRERFSSSK